MKVSYPNSWFLQFGLLSPRLFFASSTSLKGQIFKSSALFFNKKKKQDKKCVLPPGWSGEAEKSPGKFFHLVSAQL